MLQLLKKVIRAPRSGECDLLVTDGKVGCPNSAGDVGVDACLGCPRLRERIIDEKGQTWIRCTPALRA